jgi:hypothetical protein
MYRSDVLERRSAPATSTGTTPAGRQQDPVGTSDSIVAVLR